MGLPVLSGAQPTCLPDGDVDQNGSVTAADALLVFQQALGLAQLDTCQQTIADVFPQPDTPDGAITASDALCIFQKALSLPSCLNILPSSDQPPVVDAGPDQSAEAGVMVFLSGTASDADGAIASYAWTQTGGITVSLTGADAATAVFVAPEVSVDETLTFRLTVTDDAGSRASDEVRVTVHPAMEAAEPTTAAEVFRQAVSAQIVQAKCVNCHVQGGASGNTRLVFVRAADTPDHEALNLQTFQEFLAAVADEGGGSYVLNKIQGVGHGGGVQVSPGTEAFANMQQFLGLLGEEVAPPAPVTVGTLFDTVIMASPRKTLRRAALIFAGRIPTEAEYAAVEGGDETVLRATIRGLMEGSQFHEFLIRASNDRLLTDRGAGIDSDGYFVAFNDEHYRRKKAAHASGDESAWDDFYIWEDRVQYGVTRSPLELIAHVVENDQPYTEILTADYIMANSWAAAAYGASTYFDHPEDVHEFKPSRIVSYYRKGDGFKAEYDPALDATLVHDPGPLITEYPHAGILNTLAFLQRYPSTATNRNRARARWTYYHFLGHDVEKSASRTTDPMALADTNNPTMHNPNCTVCHSVLDPVAGAFQNYGDDGMYKDQWGGLDSLDEFYKKEEGPSLATVAGSWEERETLSWSLTLLAGAQTLRVIFTNPAARDENDGSARHAFLDRLTVTDADGDVVASHEFEEMGPPVAHWGPCGEGYDNPATGRRDALWLHWGERHCAMYVDLQIPATGVYTVGIIVWSKWDHRSADRLQDDGEPGFARFSVVANAYEEGDTCYRDMRSPGFAGMEAQNTDNSVQWLARQIAADERFAGATVKFWWPAIMGSEVVQPPEDAADADFEGRLLAANAQGAELERLASGFRSGFRGSPYTYNLKDLLVEIVLSQWFRADAVTDADPVRRVALQDAGAKRLLTPEELARKTDALTGFQWGRRIRTHCWPVCERLPNALTGNYRLLYGGIDSDGITERARDVTSVMAGVAKRHAAQVSCPVVMREVFLLPDADRRLFAGFDPDVTPVSEFSAVLEVEAASWEEREPLSMSGFLAAGPKNARVTFTNGYYDEVNRRHRKVRLDRLAIRNAAGETVASVEFEDLQQRGRCNNGPYDEFYWLHCPGTVDVPIEIPTAGSHVIEIVAWADHAGDELPKLNLTVESDSESSAGSAIVKSNIVELYDKLLGVQVTPDSPDVEAAYRFFVNVWERQRESGDDWFDWGPGDCGWDEDHFFFEGILDSAVVRHENAYGHQWYKFDRDRIHAFLDRIDFSDPSYTAQTWVVVLAAMMMNYRYLYL